MPITLIGQDAMRPLLSALGRIVIANRTDPGDDVTIVAIAAARHRSDGSSQADTAFGLSLEADESVGLEAIPAESEMPEAIEVLLRLRIGGAGTIVDAYTLARRSATDLDASYEVGVKRHNGVLVDGEVLVDGFSDFAVYGLPAG